MQQDVVHQLAAGAVAPSFDVLQFTDPNYRIQSVTCFNDSTLTISFYFGTQSPQGAPSFFVRPGQAVTFPVKMQQMISVSYAGSALYAGFVYIEYDDTPKAASSSTINGADFSVPSTWGFTGQTVAAGSNVAIGIAQPHIAQAPDPTGYFTSQLLISHLYLESAGIPAGTDLLIRARNLRTGQIYEAGEMGFNTTIDEDFGIALPIYVAFAPTNNQDQLGDAINVECVVANVPSNTTVDYTLGLLLK